MSQRRSNASAAERALASARNSIELSLLRSLAAWRLDRPTAWTWTRESTNLIGTVLLYVDFTAPVEVRLWDPAPG